MERDTRATKSTPFVPGVDARTNASKLPRPEWSNHVLDQRIIDSMVGTDRGLLAELSKRGVDKAAVLAYARALGISGEFVRRCRLSGSRPAMRACVNCDGWFLSAGIHNRLCRRCATR